MRPVAWLLILLAGVCVAADRTGPAGTVDAALAAAARERRPLLLEFDALWCHSCYYMATHVQTGARWRSLQARARLLVLDGDSPEGARAMERFGVKALPTYLVLKADASELGRIIGEQPPDRFYAALGRILAGDDELGALQARARRGSVDAIAQALATFYARDEYDPGLAWYASLVPALRRRAGRDARVALWRDRLKLLRALARHDQASCVAAARRVLAGPVGCDRYYVVESLLDCSTNLPARRRSAVLAPQRPALHNLLDHQVLVAAPTCADQRTAVLAAAELDAAVDGERAQDAVLERAIAFVRKTLHGDYAADRNLADNLRVYLDRADRTAEYDALLPKLIAAYPDDYVFSFHFGSTLLERGEPARALPYLEQAARRAYGANQLIVAARRVDALLALHRRADAERVVAEALRQSGPWFPEEAAQLRASLEHS